ncbi:MAG: SGNH/GDSL hydrolase family protein, partial [Verrucomicrobiota bacterium]
KPLKEMMQGKADVVHNQGNAGNTGRGLIKIDDWLGQDQDTWDVIHFNWGLWDLCYRNSESKNQGCRDKINGTVTHPPGEYEQNLNTLVKRLKQTGAKLVWASTTPVPEGELGRKLGDDLVYNKVAEKIMKANNIPVNDLHAHILPDMTKLQTKPGDVHFKPAGSKKLARKVAQEIEALLR